jgi:hypothetical protein
MNHRFLDHNLNHTVFLVDATSIGMPSEIDVPEGKPQTVPSFCFRSWTLAEKYLRERGAGNIALQGLQEALKKNADGVLPLHEHDFRGPCLAQVLLVFGTLLQADISRQIGTNPRI